MHVERCITEPMPAALLMIRSSARLRHDLRRVKDVEISQGAHAHQKPSCVRPLPAIKMSKVCTLGIGYSAVACER